MLIYVHLADGFEEIEAVTIIDILKRAGVEAVSVSVTGQKMVTGAHGIKLQADILYEDADYQSCGMLVLPGGMPGTANLAGHAGLMKHIECFANNGKLVAAICAAPMVLGNAGLLEGRRATIYPGMEAHLKGAVKVTDRVVIDDKIITSRGPGTAMEFALELSKLAAGAAKADKVRMGLVLEI